MADARDRKEHLTASDGGYFVIDEVDAAHTDTSDTDTAADADTIESADAADKQAADDAAASDEAVLEKAADGDKAPADGADDQESEEGAVAAEDADADDADSADASGGADDTAAAGGDSADAAAPQDSDFEDSGDRAEADKDEDDESELFEHDVVCGEDDAADSEDADSEPAALTAVLPVVEDTQQESQSGQEPQEPVAKKRSPLDAVRKQADAVAEYFKDQQALERPQGRVLLGEDAVLHDLPEHEAAEVDKDDLIGPSEATIRSALPYSPFGSSPSETAGRSVRIDRRLGLTLGLVAVVLVIAFAIVAAVAANAAKQGAVVASLNSRVGLTLKIDAKGLDESGSMVPVSVTGTTAGGDAVDKVVFVDMEGKGIFVAPGTYELAIAGSPIAGNGTVYEVPDSSIEVDVPSADEAVVESTFKLKPISASKTTEEQIDDAYQAIADGGCEPDKAVELKLKASERAGIED